MEAEERPVEVSKLQIDAHTCGLQLAWCRGGNLIAVSVRDPGGPNLQISLLDPEAQQVGKCAFYPVLDLSVLVRLSNTLPANFSLSCAVDLQAPGPATGERNRTWSP